MIFRHLSRTVVGALALLAGCTTNVTGSAPTGGGATPSADAGARPTISKKDLAGNCGFGCEPGVVCGGKNTECAAGYCVFDGRPGFEPDAYCSADCDNADCPLGYTCETVSHSSRKLCVAKRGTCGDGEVQGQESCDDGNEKDFDACSLGCRAGQAVARAKLAFGLRGDAVEASINGSLPLEGDAAGCGVIALENLPGNAIRLRLAACKEDTGERVTWAVKFPNRVGRVQLRLADVEAHFKAGGRPMMEAIPSCSGDCGISVDVVSAWGTESALKLVFEGLYRKSTDDQGAFSTFTLSGSVRIGTDGDDGSMSP